MFAANWSNSSCLFKSPLMNDLAAYVPPVDYCYPSSPTCFETCGSKSSNFVVLPVVQFPIGYQSPRNRVESYPPVTIGWCASLFLCSDHSEIYQARPQWKTYSPHKRSPITWATHPICCESSFWARFFLDLYEVCLVVIVNKVLTTLPSNLAG